MIRGALIFCAACATAYATMAFLVGPDGSFKVAAVLAAVCLGGVTLLDHARYERDRRLARGREAVWTRRDREAR